MVGSSNRDDLMAFDLTASPAAPFVLKANIDTSDPLKLPGDPMITVSGNGNPSLIVSGDGAAVYLQGDGYKASFAPQPFIDKVDRPHRRHDARVRRRRRHLSTIRCVALDADLSRVIVSRESKTTVPDSYLWTASSKQFENLTSNKDPWPEITARQAGGLRVHATGRRQGQGPHHPADELSARHPRAGGVLGLPARVRGWQRLHARRHPRPQRQQRIRR